jgi:hypothetical protein
MTRILSIDPTPIHTLSYQFAKSGGRTAFASLPILLGTVDALPPCLDGLICTSDLQGMIPQSSSLLGEALAEEISLLTELDVLPSPSGLGVLLAGDLFAEPTKRGGRGDVRLVWNAFLQRFRWVTGIPGNHDSFGEAAHDLSAFLGQKGLHYLDGTVCDVDGLKVAGVGGIIGNPAKPFRRSEVNYRHVLEECLAQHPDLVLLHESPAIPERSYLGSLNIRAILGSTSNLVICGHSHWDEPFVQLTNGCQVLNVDARVVILCPERG